MAGGRVCAWLQGRVWFRQHSRGTTLHFAKNQACFERRIVITSLLFAILSWYTWMHQEPERQTDDDKKDANGTKCN